MKSKNLNGIGALLGEGQEQYYRTHICTCPIYVYAGYIAGFGVWIIPYSVVR